jgi:hypothetical protein
MKNLLTQKPANLLTCQPFNLLTCYPLNLLPSSQLFAGLLVRRHVYQEYARQNGE